MKRWGPLGLALACHGLAACVVDEGVGLEPTGGGQGGNTPGGWDGNGQERNPLLHRHVLRNPAYAEGGTGPSTWANHLSLGLRAADVEVPGCEAPASSPAVDFAGTGPHDAGLIGPHVLVDGRLAGFREPVTFTAELVDGNDVVDPAVVTLTWINRLRHPRAPNLVWPSYVMTACSVSRPEPTLVGVVTFMPMRRLDALGRMVRVPGLVEPVMTYFHDQKVGFDAKAAINTHLGVDLAEEGHVLVGCATGAEYPTLDVLDALAPVIGNTAVAHWPGTEEELWVFMTRDDTPIQLAARARGNEPLCHPRELTPATATTLPAPVEALRASDLQTADAIFAIWDDKPAEAATFSGGLQLGIGGGHERVDAYLEASQQLHKGAFAAEREARGAAVVIGEHRGVFTSAAEAFEVATPWADLVATAGVAKGTIDPSSPGVTGVVGGGGLDDELRAYLESSPEGDDVCGPNEDAHSTDCDGGTAPAAETDGDIAIEAF